jgi:hypothetical protein
MGGPTGSNCTYYLNSFLISGEPTACLRFVCPHENFKIFIKIPLLFVIITLLVIDFSSRKWTSLQYRGLLRVQIFSDVSWSGSGVANGEWHLVVRMYETASDFWWCGCMKRRVTFGGAGVWNGEWLLVVRMYETASDIWWCGCMKRRVTFGGAGVWNGEWLLVVPVYQTAGDILWCGCIKRRVTRGGGRIKQAREGRRVCVRPMDKLEN